MPKLKRYCVFVLLPILCSSPVWAKDYQCTFEQRFKGGGSKGAKIELGVVDGKINKLVVYSLVSSGNAAGGYMCGIDTTSKQQVVKWSVRDKKTVLKVDDSTIVIEQVNSAYRINLEDASREACGFGAEWPEYLVIRPGNPTCWVKE